MPTNNLSDQSATWAIDQLEKTEANLKKLERLWEEILAQQPGMGQIAFGDQREHDQLRRQYQQVLEGLPAINGWKPTSIPFSINEVSQMRFDALEIGELSAKIAVEEDIERPSNELAEYRFRLSQQRSRIIREVVSAHCLELDVTISQIGEAIVTQDDRELIDRDGPNSPWFRLSQLFGQLHDLLGSRPRPARWGDMARHIRFGEVHDFRDIQTLDWPSIRTDLEKILYSDDEPIPVAVSDLSEIEGLPPSTSAQLTSLQWRNLSSTDFERLVFELVSRESGYENVRLLMPTYAPDNGRDISCDYVSEDRLRGTKHQRVIIQCRHLTRSMGVGDVSELVAQVKLWEPPRVDILVIAATGRFSKDAVAYVERHNQSDSALTIDLWADTHLERILAQNPDLIAQFRLREDPTPSK